MNKLKNVWVVAADNSVAELTAGAAELGENVVLTYAGDRNAAVNADTAFYLGALGTENSFICYIPALLELIKEAAPDLVLMDSSKNGRLIAAYIAAAFGTSVQADAAEVTVVHGAVQTKRMIYGGSAFKTELSDKTAVVCASAGVFETSETVPAARIIDVDARCDGRVRFIQKKEKTEVSVNLAAAKRVVGIGRGLSEESDLELCREFCKTLGAEMGCSRPISEEKKWLPTASYIGVSGAMIKPDFYFAIGISGQIQHVVGASESGVIIAVDKNEAAPIFNYCDYGIVGDLRKIIPTLTKLIKE